MLRTALPLFLLPLALTQASELAAAIDRLLAAPAAQRVAWGIHVVDLASGRTLYARQENLAFTPASNTKLFTTALALTRLGPDHRFHTRILAPAPLDANGVLAGDLVLLGGGDPTLSPRAIPYQKGPIEGDPLVAIEDFAARLTAAGLRRVTGDVVGDDTLYPWVPYPEGWTLNDQQWEYGAPVSALVVNDNAFALTVLPAAAAGGPARLALRPPLEYFTFDNRLRTAAGRERHIFFDREAGSRLIRITGEVAPGGPGTTQLLAVDDPALFAATALADALQRRGVAIGGRPAARHRQPEEPFRAPQGVVLAEHTSPPLSETLRVIDKVSQNLHAEIVLRETARVRRGDASPRLIDEERKQFLAELGCDPPRTDFADGSGLSRRTLFSPADMTRLLAFMHRSEHRDLWWSLLPAAGEDGTLAGRFHGVAGASNVRAKTGSIAHVNSLSGYIGATPAWRVAFAILTNNATASAAEVRAMIDRIVVTILEQGLL